MNSRGVTRLGMFEFSFGQASRLTQGFSLEQMRKEGGREGRAKVALAARRLLSLSKETEGVDGAEEVSVFAN